MPRLFSLHSPRWAITPVTLAQSGLWPAALIVGLGEMSVGLEEYCASRIETVLFMRILTRRPDAAAHWSGDWSMLMS